MRNTWCAILAALSLGSHQSQTPVPTPAQTSTQIHAVSRIVIVPATVRAKSGQFAAGLNSSDFELTDNGVRQSVDVEQTGNQQLAVVLIMQTGASSYREFQNYQTITSLLGILRGSRAQKVAFITFDSKPRQVWNFPTRLDGVQYAIDHPEVGDTGASILDALSQGINLLQQQPPGMRRIIFLLSESQDAGSKIEPVRFLHHLGESNIAVYSIAFPSKSATTQSQRYEACIGKSEVPQNQASFLQDILKRLCRNTTAEVASLSGGEQIEIKNPLDLNRGISMLNDAFTNAYVLSFHPALPSAGLHLLSLKAGTQRRRLFASSRRVYWVQ